METLVPAVYFKGIDKESSETFIHLDRRVKSTPTLLYVHLFRCGYTTGICYSPQIFLAELCKCSIRALQGHIRKLEALNYIKVEPQPNGSRAYRLIINDRVRLFSGRALHKLYGYQTSAESAHYHAQNQRVRGEKSARGHTQNLPVEGEKSARPPLKRIKDLKTLTPLSPLPPKQRQCLRVTASSRSTFPGTSGDRPLPETGGRGESFSSGKDSKDFLTANAAFEQFLAAYPRKEAREAARGVWHQLRRCGELPALDKLLAALDQFRETSSWTKEHGRFVPYAVNWLRARRWLDFSESERQSTPASASSPSPERLQTLPEVRPDPALEAVRPLFERFFERFHSKERRGPAWGLWASLFRKGHAPSADDVKGRGMMDAFAFLQAWQRGAYATA
ncbi:MAG: helix-turn-helix domain-containing protein [Desulfovibrio sp.]|nr:helix-turn-helix domain-containing protein [Desulfovibrio sp.]